MKKLIKLIGLYIITVLCLVFLLSSCATTKYKSPKKMGSDACPHSKHKRVNHY
jgi:hypothetical protein